MTDKEALEAACAAYLENTDNALEPKIEAAIAAYQSSQSGHTRGEYRAYELGRKEAIAECVTALQELVQEYDAKQYASVAGKLRELIARILVP